LLFILEYKNIILCLLEVLLYGHGKKHKFFTFH
jgi:hypothetical protein